MGDYHIIHAMNAPARVQILPSACGKDVPRNKMVSILAPPNPNWDKDWCHDCVRAFAWEDERKQIWREMHGVKFSED